MGLSILVSFTPSPDLELPRGQWTLQWDEQFFSRPAWMQALAHSLGIAGLTALFSVLTAFATAMALVRRTLRWKALWESAMLLPIVLPAIALAVGMLAAVRLTPLWGNPLSLALSHSVLAVPVAYMVI